MTKFSVEDIRQDLKFAGRNLRKSPGFLAVVVFSLALGIGANSTVFSVINAALFRPLPYPHMEQLAVIWDTEQGQPDSRQYPPIAALNDWKKQSRLFDDIALTSFIEAASMAEVGEAQVINAQNVTPNYFSLLGVKPEMGRVFFAEEMQDKSIAVVLTNRFWRSKFNADPDVIGRTFDMQGSVATVVGVMPADRGTIWDGKLDMWLPVDPNSNRFAARIDHWLMPIGRLKPGVTLAQAQVEMNVIAERLASEYPASNKGVGEIVTSFQDFLHEGVGRFLYPLLGAVAFVLLIGCVNVANLLQSRTEGRRKEYALRSALGAGRGRLTQQMLIESGLLAVIGGVCGILLTFVGTPAFNAIAGDFASEEKIPMDWRVMLFTLGISLFTAILFGIAPAIQASRVNPNVSLREGERKSVGKSRGYARQALAVVEIAMAMVLLVGAGLLIDSILRLKDVNPGFDARNVLTAQVQLPEGGKYVEHVGQDMEKMTPAVDAFYKQLLQKLAALPGVESVASASVPPNESSRGFTFAILSRPAPAPDARPTAAYSETSPGFFQTMRIPLRKGRFLDEHDTAGAPWGVLVNEALVRKYFPNEDPIGQPIRLRYNPYPVDEDRARVIVGVVGDVKNRGLERDARPTIYTSTLQQPGVVPGGTSGAHTAQSILIKMLTGDPGLEGAAFAAMRKSVEGIDPNVPLIDTTRMDALLDRSITGFRFYRNVLGVFAGIALLLAVIGIYGVMSYFVTQRTHEIGIRVALGAEPGDVLALVGRLGLKLSVIGVVAGAGLAMAMTRLIAAFLYGVKPTDPVTYAMVAIGLVGVALTACLVPARRAVKVDPMVALRHE